MCLIGNTDQRGHAWHYRAGLQGDQPNHYPGPIPVDDVRRRLFDWTAESRRVAQEAPADVDTMTHLSDGGHTGAVGADPQPAGHRPVRQRPRDGHLRRRLRARISTTSGCSARSGNILDDDLCVSSAGLLREGAVAWVEVSVPEAITTPEGVVFRPNLLATTSFDGSIATTFKRTVTDVGLRQHPSGRAGRDRARPTRSSTPGTRSCAWRTPATRWPWSTAWPTSSPPR